MSNLPETADLEKCVSLRLWHTALFYLEHIFHSNTGKFDNANFTAVFEEITQFLGTVEKIPENKWIDSRLMILEKEEKNNDVIEKSVDEKKKDFPDLHSMIEKKRKNQNVDALSQEYVQFLRSNIFVKPAITCWLINELLIQWLNHAKSSNENSRKIEFSLQDVYFKGINVITIKSLPWQDSSEKKQDFNYVLKKKKPKFVGKEDSRTLLCKLSKLEATETEKDEFFYWLFPLLLETCDTSDIELSLLSRKSLELLLDWNAFLDANYLLFRESYSVRNALNIMDLIFYLDNDTKDLIGERHKHWLIQVLNICLTCITNQNLQMASQILSCHAFENTWPWLLVQYLNSSLPLTLLNKTTTNSSMCLAINFLFKNSVCITPNSTVANKLKVTEWILKQEQKKNLMNQENLSINKILSYLDASIILSVPNSNISDFLKTVDENPGIFQAYRILLSVVKGILSCENHDCDHQIVEKHFSKARILLNPLDLHLKLKTMENVFTFLFIKEETSKITFACNKFAMKEICDLLKKSICEMEHDLGDADVENIDGLKDRVENFKKASQDFFEKIFYEEVLLEIEENSGTRGNNSNIIVNSMLSSEENLVLQCLWQGDLEKSQKVIRMFHLDDAKVGFSNASSSLVYKNSVGDEVDSENSLFKDAKQTAQNILETPLMANEVAIAQNQRILSTNSMSIKELVTLAVLSLALTIGHDDQKSINLRELATKYLKSCEKLKNTGHFHIISSIHNLLYSEKLCVPITDVLHDASVPISFEERKSKLSAELRYRLREFRISQSKCSSEQEIFRRIIDFCGNEESCLHKALSHLEVVCEIFSKDEENSIIIAETMLLKNFLDSYPQHQTLHPKNEPKNHQLLATKVNSTQSVHENFFQNLTSIDNEPHEFRNDHWGRIVLNHFPDEVTPSLENADPNKHVSEILSKLIRTFCILLPIDDKVSRESVSELASSELVKKVLRKTRDLAYLDLSELSVGNDTLVFFLNVWNLLFLHSILTVWEKDPPVNNLRRVMSQMVIGYEIGDLGFVTLATLKHKLLGALPWDPEYFSQADEINEPIWQDLDVTQEPMLLFAMVNEFSCSPLINIYDSENLDADLDTAARFYLDFNSLEEEQTITIPKLMEYFLQSNHVSANSNALINKYLKTSKTMKYLDLLPTYEITFQYEKLKVQTEFPLEEKDLSSEQRTNGIWEILEKRLKENRLQECLDLTRAIPERIFLNNVELQFFKDKVLSDLILKSEDLTPETIIQLVYQIRDVIILAQTILGSLQKRPVKVCEEMLMHILDHPNKNSLPDHCKSRMKETLCRVNIFQKMQPYFTEDMMEKNMTWYDVVYCTSKTDPAHIVQSLTNGNKFELFLEWIEHQVISSKIQSLVTQDLLIGLLENEENDFKNTSKLLRAVPQSQSLNMCKGILERLESTRAMRFIVRYLIESQGESQEYKGYHKTLIGIDILDQLQGKEQSLYKDLVEEPLLMLEQLLMNCKFDHLERILGIVREPMQEIDTSFKSFDKIVRFYAGKSLDFRVFLDRNDEGKIKDTSLSNGDFAQTDEFVMPENVPKKEEWIPNDKAKECSCCRVVIFSMFNRRHHCRRCGRVVCHACSQHRMQVAGYPSTVLVRVCNDCKQQMALQQPGASSSTCPKILECWKLTTDETLNQTVREKFAFEHVPNVSLCLRIMNLHSDHYVYASYLLDRCEEMKRLLRAPIAGKVDYTLVIKMIRSLLVAAKVKYAELGLSTELAHCDSFISQVDLITILVQADCPDLIPADELDERTLSKLQYHLTQKEQWALALDVSTKSGLETQGVWAAWGKACLRTGYLDLARTRFSHCLERVVIKKCGNGVDLSYPEENASPETKSGKKLERNRPVEDPPLLVEILQILESYSHSKTDSAQEIPSNLNNLKSICQGVHPSPKVVNGPDSVFYLESLHYLLTYGSVNSVLEFYIKQDEYEKCLTFLLNNDVEAETFHSAVYLRCSKIGSLEKMLDTMKRKDASLLTWKKYLVFTCRNLEKEQLLHSLYYLQSFMKDYIRASMTCIRFYESDASSYSDLYLKKNLLENARQHLECELKAENLNRRKKSTGSSGGRSLTMRMSPAEIDRHLMTISRQLEITEFLKIAEEEGGSIGQVLSHLEGVDVERGSFGELPTLFGNHQEKTKLAVLAIVCGKNVEEGFSIAFRIMQDYNLRMQRVYYLAGQILMLEKRISCLEQLVKCCRSSGAPNSQSMSDCLLIDCVRFLLSSCQSDSNPNYKDQVDCLIQLIIDVELKINAYIESKQLKAAYLLAVKYSRTQDIRKILQEADKLGQKAIGSICVKWLERYEKTMKGDS